MNIIGIDPGPQRSALVVASFQPFELARCYYGDNDDIAVEIAEAGPFADRLALEFVQSYGRAVGASVFETAFWCGRFAEVGDSLFRLPFSLVPASKWRSHLTQCARNTDATVRQALRVRFGEARKGQPLEGVTKHLWDALGVAVYVADGERLGGWQDAGTVANPISTKDGPLADLDDARHEVLELREELLT